MGRNKLGPLYDLVASMTILLLVTDTCLLAAAPVVYTSYDYSAPLRETRQQWDKLFQTKLIGLFTRVSSDLLVTEMAGNGTGYKVTLIPAPKRLPF
jgi:hypothetical protein